MFTLFKTLSYNLTLISSLFADGIQLSMVMMVFHLKDVPTNSQWNRIPDQVRNEVVELALEVPELSPRELAHRMIDQNGYFISESSVYRILKSRGLITSPAYM